MGGKEWLGVGSVATIKMKKSSRPLSREIVDDTASFASERFSNILAILAPIC
jgi:hypothetical protein